MRLRYVSRLAAALVLFPSVSISQTTAGSIWGVENWDSSMNPIIVTGDVTVEAGATLNIGPGTEVRFRENNDDTRLGWDIRRSELIVYGTLNINGAADSVVVLTSTGTAAGGWFGIVFADNAATGTIQYCNIDRSVFGINFTACDGPHYGRVTYDTLPPATDRLRADFCDFVSLGVTAGMTVYNDTKGTVGVVTGISSTPDYPGSNNLLLIAGGMTGGAVNDPGDYFHFNPGGPAPSVSNCLVNDVVTGFYFDNEASPMLTGCSVINAATGYSFWGFSSPVLVKCNAAQIEGEGANALYATEYSNAVAKGCAFSSGSVTLDMDANLTMIDTTISSARNGIVGLEVKGSDHGGSVLSSCSAVVDNCNIIGVGDEGIGVAWDDNLNPLTVQYSRLGGFVTNVEAQWGSVDTGIGLYHMAGPRFAEWYYGVCTGGDVFRLIDDTVDFQNLGAAVGMTVYNLTDLSSAVVTDITSIPPGAYNTLVTGGMSGGHSNDPGDIYRFNPTADYNNIDLGDAGAPSVYRNWPPGHVPSRGYNEFYGRQNPKALYNIMMTGSSPPPNLYQLEVWAQNNWWQTTNHTVISRYIWDDDPFMGKVHYVPNLDRRLTYSVSGIVVDGFNEPVEGVRVETDISAQFQARYGVGGHTVLADITDAEGYYTIYGLVPDNANPYTVTAAKLGHIISPPSFTFTLGSAAPSDIVGRDFTASLPAPVITGVGRRDGADGAPNRLPGRTNWGLASETTDIVVTGLNFRDTPAVFIRGPIPASSEDIPCTNVAMEGSTRLTATLPAGRTPGNYAVRVVNPDGAPAVWGINTFSGTCTGGSGVTLTDTATNFTARQVGLYAHLTNDTDGSTGVVTGVTGASNETIQIAGGMSGGAVNDPGDAYTVYAAPGFTIVPPPGPSPSAVTPNPINYNYDGYLTITGRNFLTGCSVAIGGKTWQSLAPGGGGGVLTVYYAPNTLGAGTWPVTVTNPDGQFATLANGLTVNGPPPPVVQAISPSSGPNNRVIDVAITGLNFAAAPTVRIGPTHCMNVVFVDSAHLTAQVPTGITPGVYDVIIVNPDGISGSLRNGYTVLEPAVAVYGVSPPMGLAGAETDIIVVGDNIKSAAGLPAVEIGKAPVWTACTNVRVVSSTCIMATVPNTVAPGLYDVRIDNVDPAAPGLKADLFTAVGTPGVTGVAPAGGASNKTVTIEVNGSGFAYIPKVEIMTATPIRCTDVRFVSAAQLKANVPSGIAPGTYDVRVTNPLGPTVSLANAYTVNAAPPGEPDVRSVTPAGGNNDGPTDIVIGGTNFAGTTGVTVGGTACTDVVVVDATHVTATVPGGLRVGSHDLAVTNAVGTGTLTHGFAAGGSGTISADTTVAGTVYLTGDVVVEPGVTLTLEPGARLIFEALADDSGGGWDDKRGELRLYGRLNSLGEQSDHVALTSSEGASSDWLGVVFSDSTASALIEYTDVTSAVNGLCLESNIDSPDPGGKNPRPWVQNIYIANCATGVSLNSSLAFTCPAVDTCTIDTAGIGIAARSTSAPIFTRTLLRNVTGTGIQARGNSILTIHGSSIVDPPAAVSCPAAGAGEAPNAAALNVVFSVLGNGSVGLSDSARLTARMATFLLFPGTGVGSGVLGEKASAFRWDHSNIVQGDPSGVGVEWRSAGDCRINATVIAGWGIGVRRAANEKGDCGAMDLGDGASTGWNEFLGVMNPSATTFNVVNSCPTGIDARSNWWLTTDTSVIGNYLYDSADDPALGAIDITDYLTARRTYSISGRIVDGAGAPVDRVQVVALHATAHSDNDRMAMTDDSGKYTIYGLVPGTYTITFEKQGYNIPSLGTVTVTDTDLNGKDVLANVAPPTVYGIRREDGLANPPYGTHWAYRPMGADVVVTGLNFRSGAMAALVGPLPATTANAMVVKTLSSTTITATVPAGLLLGGYGVMVTNPDGHSATWGADAANPAFTIIDPPPPVVYSVSPASVYKDYNDVFIVDGANFFGVPEVHFGDVAGYYSFDFPAYDPKPTDTRIWIRIAPGDLLSLCDQGPQPVQVFNPDGQGSNRDVTLTVNGPPPPTVGSVIPPSGANNEVLKITIEGTAFIETPEVTLIHSTTGDEVECINETFVSGAEITAEVPLGIARGIYTVRVCNPPCSAGAPPRCGVLGGGYEVLSPPLSVIGVSPPMGLAGGETDIIVVGVSFDVLDYPAVLVGATHCTNVRVVSPTCILATAPPAMAAGLHDLEVRETPPGPSATLANAFTAVGTPGVTGVAPAGGASNKTVQIDVNGSGFAYIPKVEIMTAPGPTRCTGVRFLSAAQLKANVPSGIAPGTYGVRVTNPLGPTVSLANAYTVNAAPPGEPAVTSVTPAGGTNDKPTDITIRGTNFTGATGVTVGGTACTGVTVVSGTQLTARVPADKQVGSCDVTVTTPSGTGTLTHGFTVGGFGTLSTDTTIAGSAAITGDIVVPRNTTLTIEPGSTLVFSALSDASGGGLDTARAELNVYGRINILGEGAGTAPTLTSSGSSPSDWLGIALSDTTSSAWIEGAYIRYAVRGLDMESSLALPTASNPRPWIRNADIWKCATGISLNSSAAFTCPAFDSCTIHAVGTGITAGGTTAPILTSTLCREIGATGIEGKGSAIVTIAGSSVIDAPEAVSCPAAGAGEATNASILNLVFSVLGNGTIGISDSAMLNARMVTHLLFPNTTAIAVGLSGDTAASARWSHSNIVQGNATGIGVEWKSANRCDIDNTVFAGWGVGLKRQGGCGAVNLGDSAATGGNEFLGMLNPSASYNVENECEEDMSAQFNWWQTTDDTLIEKFLYDGDDVAGLGRIDHSGHLMARRTYSVSGRIVDGSGNPADRVQVSALYSAPHTDNDRLGMTDQNGDYIIYGLIPGAFTITPEKQGYTFTPATLPVTITDTDLGGRDFVMIKAVNTPTPIPTAPTPTPTRTPTPTPTRTPTPPPPLLLINTSPANPKTFGPIRIEVNIEPLKGRVVDAWGAIFLAGGGIQFLAGTPPCHLSPAAAPFASGFTLNDGYANVLLQATIPLGYEGTHKVVVGLIDHGVMPVPSPPYNFIPRYWDEDFVTVTLP
mgnify:CR=1 FL=1